MRNTQVQVEEIRNQKYSRLGGMDERLKNQGYGMDGRLEILKVRWQGWKIGYT